MNGEYYQNPIFPNNDTLVEKENNNIIGVNILEINKGKRVNIYTTFDKTISGILEYYKDNYLIISNPESGNNNLIPDKYIYYIEFIEKINY